LHSCCHTPCMRGAGYAEPSIRVVARVTPTRILREEGQGNGRIRRPFFGKTAMEPIMAERRKTTRLRKTAARKSSRRTATAAKKSSPKRWSQRVTRESDALDLKRGIFKLASAKKIAASLKRSAEHSSRRKAGAYRSALSMLTFYINRAGKTLPKTQRTRLERAKLELKHQFGRA
jgi:Protein of unknown function (DUF3175)